MQRNINSCTIIVIQTLCRKARYRKTETEFLEDVPRIRVSLYGIIASSASTGLASIISKSDSRLYSYTDKVLQDSMSLPKIVGYLTRILLVLVSTNSMLTCLSERKCTDRIVLASRASIDIDRRLNFSDDWIWGRFYANTFSFFTYSFFFL